MMTDFNAAEIAAREMLLSMTSGNPDSSDSAVWFMTVMARSDPDDTVTILKVAAVLSKLVANYTGISVAEVIEMTLKAIAHAREGG